MPSGKKFIRPFGSFGRSYKYSRNIYRNYIIKTVFILFFSFLIFTLIVFSFLNRHSTLKATIEAMAILIISEEAIRYIVVSSIFNINNNSVNGEDVLKRSRIFFVDPPLSTIVISLMVFYESLSYLGMVMDLVHKTEKFFTGVGIFIIFHSGLYLYTYCINFIRSRS